MYRLSSSTVGNLEEDSNQSEGRAKHYRIKMVWHAHVGRPLRFGFSFCLTVQTNNRHHAAFLPRDAL